MIPLTTFVLGVIQHVRSVLVQKTKIALNVQQDLYRLTNILAIVSVTQKTHTLSIMEQYANVSIRE